MSLATVLPSVIFADSDYSRGRRTSRTLNFDALAQQAQSDAIDGAKWVIRAHHGGSVPNCYQYPATTDGAIVVSDPRGRTVVWRGTLSANSVTHCGVARSVLPGGVGADAWDGRCGDSRKRAAIAAIKTLHAESIAD